MDEQLCPECRRRIIVENGRWTRHTDPASWDRITRSFEQCRNAGRVAAPTPQPKETRA